MNILIPHTWLLEHLDTNADPKIIQENLSLAGPSVERIYEREGDSVYDIEITSNRVDSMSVRGTAREAAVILEQFGIHARLKDAAYESVPLDLDTSEGQELPLPKIENNPDLCERVMAIVLRDVERTPTPEWMAKRLRQVEMNIHDSAIDITNYITHEAGHPIHAFDYDKLMALGGEIIVKEAEPGKSFTTLDGISYETIGGEVVFENQEGDIIDLPSIKGTQNTSIDDSTRNVLLLIDSIAAKKIRTASMTHQIRTVAAQLKEKHVDPHLGLPTLQRGVMLYRELCNAKVASPLYDDFPGQRQLDQVSLPLEKIEAYLGIQIEQNKIAAILESLGCQVSSRENFLDVQPPTFRPDLQIPADLIEEVARIYGYHNLPSTLMDTKIPLSKQEGVDFTLEAKIKYFLAHIGWQEVYSYSVVSASLAEASGYSPDKHLKLENPLTEDHVYLRRSLWPSLNQLLNDNPLVEQLSVFEIANTYLPVENDLPRHELRLGMVSSKPYREVKGDLEAMLDTLYLAHTMVRPLENHRSQAGELFAVKKGKEHLIGIISVLPGNRTGIDILMDELASVASAYPSLQPIPKSAPVIEDMTFTLPEKTYSGQVLEAIRSQGDAIDSVILKDKYQQNYTFTITYSHPMRAVSTDEVKPIRQKIANALESQFSAELVGEV